MYVISVGSRSEWENFSFSCDATLLSTTTTEVWAGSGEAAGGGAIMALRADEADGSPMQPIPVVHCWPVEGLDLWSHWLLK